jgi:S-adenosylmethionine:tRNA ribosyltransferase-isomerase
LKKSDFYYALPERLIAQEPLSERSASRLLQFNVDDKSLQDRMFSELPLLLESGDLLVFNDTRVMPARLMGRKDSGGEVEILLERLLSAHDVRAQVRASKPLKAGRSLYLSDNTQLQVLAREGEFYVLRFLTDEPVEKILLRLGRMPLPPYIRRPDTLLDQTRYQTVFAEHLGAIAAPTAGLHFDQNMLDALSAKGVQMGKITLHVGAGTFAPMRSEYVRDHTMHSEWLNVGADLVAQVRTARQRGKRVIAVGTTVVRALEAASAGGELMPFAGETQIYIFPGYTFRTVDGLITNFHLPESTLLMLVSAFAGREGVLKAYEHAVTQGYRFFSYGDAMCLLPTLKSKG